MQCRPRMLDCYIALCTYHCILERQMNVCMLLPLRLFCFVIFCFVFCLFVCCCFFFGGGGLLHSLENNSRGLQHSLENII